MYTIKPLAWTDRPINILGIEVDHDDATCAQLNYGLLVQKAKATLQTWSKRKLSLIGKIMIVNTLIGSLFVYRMTVLPFMPEHLLKDMNNAITNFIWEAKKPKIATAILQAEKDCSGLRLIDLKKKDMSLKISWVQILLQDQKMAILVYKLLNCEINKLLWETNLHSDDIETIFPDAPQFWKDVLYSWTYINYEQHTLNPMDQIVWYNSMIRTNNKPIMWKNIFQKGLVYIKDLRRPRGFISVRQAQEKFDMTLMQYNSPISAIPRSWKTHNAPAQQVTTNYEMAKVKLHISNWAYRKINYDDTLLNIKHISWETELQTELPNDEMWCLFKNIDRTTNVPKYRSFQYRLLNRAIITNIQLEKSKITTSSLCDKCKLSRETLSHLFVECPKIVDFWTEVTRFMKLFGTTPNFTTKTVLFNTGVEPAGHVKNAICLLAKHYLYRQRCLKQNVHFNEFKAMVEKIKNFEHYYAIKNNKLTKHNKKWHTI